VVHPWTEKPLEGFVKEAGARLALLMTPAGQVFAQHGFTRAVDVMAAAALAAAIVSSTGEISKMVDKSDFSTLNHQGAKHGVFLAGFDSPQGRLVLLAIYGKDSSLGLVQLFYEEFVRDLNAACPAPERTTRPVLAADFERELNESLAALFRG
jgi:predicted regulator of Ras-like GTPase activity (Roadblock/LC7/MglB family)